jgi:hypothetical protein
MADDSIYAYEVFISYSPADREWAEDWLRPRLEQAGLRVCTDDDFEPGVPKLINIERAVGNSRQALLVLTPAWIDSEWSEFAALLSQSSDPAARQRQLLPLMLQPCRVPPRIGMLTSIDFTNPNKRDKEVQRAIKVMRGELRLPKRPLSQNERNRRAMLEKVKTIWIGGLLKQSLAEVVRIDLGFVDKPDAVDLPLNLQYQELNRQPRPIPPGTPIVDVFDQMDSALLILGAPGAGKTTLLLELTRELIIQYELDESLAIPVIFNLSTWATARLPLDKWLVEELILRYDVPSRVAKEWVKNEATLPLLDGLDEVGEENVAACVQAINMYRREYGLGRLVVCCREANYKKAARRLRLQGAVIIKPLTQQQVDNYLTESGNHLTALRKLLSKDSALRMLVDTPLMLSIVVLSYRDLALSDLQKSESAEIRRRHLFETYVEQMFQRRGKISSHKKIKTVKYLSWLSNEMVVSHQSIFFVEQLQPSLLPSKKYLILYSIITGIMAGIIPCFIIGLAAIIITERIDIGLQIGVVVGSIAAIGIGFFSLLVPIECVEKITWSWLEAKQAVRQNFWRGVLWGTFSGIFMGYVQASSSSITMGISIGLTAFFSSIFAWSIYGIYRGYTATELVNHRVMPNQGIWTSAKNALTLGARLALILAITAAIVSGAIFGLNSLIVTQSLDGIAIGVRYGLLVGLSCGFLSGAMQGGFVTCIRHLILRTILQWNGALPLRLIPFLNFATDRIFLRKVGGGYIFVHRMLMEYFASLDTTAPQEEISVQTK